MRHRSVKSDRFKLLNFPFVKFNPIQSAAFIDHHKDINFICSAATSAGKTVVAEMFMSYTIKKQRRKAIFLSPLKAVTQEKYDDWTDAKHGFSKFKVSIVTGDYRLTEERIEELNNADIILLTSEMLDSRTRRIEIERNSWIENVGILVVDESHLITMEGRGDNLEVGIMRFTKQNPSARVVFLSATMDNVDELSTWLFKLNGKRSKLLKSDWRPVDLDVHYLQTDFCDRDSYSAKQEMLMKVAVDLVCEYQGDKFIIFVHSKATGFKLVKLLKSLNIPSDFHYADLDVKERRELAREFKNGNRVRALVATSTLAWGINMPARRVIILGTMRGLNQVHQIDIKQEIGRSGRYGIDPKGDAYVLIPADNAFSRELARLKGPSIVESQLNDDSILGFHLISELERRNVKTELDVIKWFERSLCSLQGGELSSYRALEILDDLKRIGCVRKVGKNFECTKLGAISAWMYFPPQDVAYWKMNFDKIIKWLDNDVALSWALGNIYTTKLNFFPKDMPVDPIRYQAQLRALNLPVGQSTPQSFLYYILLNSWTYYGDKPSGYCRGVSMDSERVVQTLRLVNKIAAKWGISKFLDTLEVRLKYGVGKELVDLCRIPFIGGKRASELFEAGIKDKDDLLKRRGASTSILGGKLFTKILKIV